MKIRHGFVSNSSSSSFLIINSMGENPQTLPECCIDPDAHFNYMKEVWADMPGQENMTYRYVNLTLPHPEGEMEFGWQWEKYNGVLDKLNYATILLLTTESVKDKWKIKEWIKKLCQKHLPDGMEGPGKKVILSIYYDYNKVHWDSPAETTASIDHQSVPPENTDCLRIFDSMEILEDFLFSPNSKIYCGNDNEDAPPGYYD